MGSMMMNGGRESGLADLRSAFKAKVQCWASFLLCTGLVVVSLLVFTFAIDTVEVASMRQPWLSLDGPRLEFIRYSDLHIHMHRLTLFWLTGRRKGGRLNLVREEA